MAKDSRFEMRMDAETKSKALRVAECQGKTLAEFLGDLLDSELDLYDYCEECERYHSLNWLEGNHGSYICRDCLEEEYA